MLTKNNSASRNKTTRDWVVCSVYKLLTLLCDFANYLKIYKKYIYIKCSGFGVCSGLSLEFPNHPGGNDVNQTPDFVRPYQKKPGIYKRKQNNTDIDILLDKSTLCWCGFPPFVASLDQQTVLNSRRHVGLPSDIGWTRVWNRDDYDPLRES